MGIVQSCLLVDGVLYAVVAMLRADGVHTSHWGMWFPTPAYEVWLAADLMLCVAWKHTADGALLVLR
jgi:hypothetical protein